MSLCISDVFTIVCQIEDDFFYIVASLGGGIVCFFATYFVFARRLKGVNEVRIANPTLTFVAVFVFLFTFLAQRVVTTFETITASFRFFDGLTCFLSLFILFIELEKNNEAWERQMVQELMVSEQKRYALLERSMDAINRKCHDLKYASKAWKAAKNDESMSEDELDEYVDVYDNIAQTGFAPLDNVLTEKSLYCEKNDILFTYIVDGGKLQFMQFIDIAVLFGNALDNAIECVMKYPESEKRIISLNVSEKEGAVRIHIENYCENAPEFVGGLPVSWKEDKQNHGYGLKSIRYIVEKYHGMFAVDCKNRMFNLNVSFPLGD
jgi:hypothetical protein